LEKKKERLAGKSELGGYGVLRAFLDKKRGKIGERGKGEATGCGLNLSSAPVEGGSLGRDVS